MEQQSVLSEAAENPSPGELREEYCVVDESCNCRRMFRQLDVAQGILDSGQFLPNRPTKGPLHLERRWVSEWERI